MPEQILAQFKGVNIRDVTARSTGANRLRVEGFSGWQRQWLRVPIAVQIICENLLLINGAVAARKRVHSYKLKAHGRGNG